MPWEEFPPQFWPNLENISGHDGLDLPDRVLVTCPPVCYPLLPLEISWLIISSACSALADSRQWGCGRSALLRAPCRDPSSRSHLSFAEVWGTGLSQNLGFFYCNRVWVSAILWYKNCSLSVPKVTQINVLIFSGLGFVI